MRRDNWLGLYSRLFLLAGIADILASFAGFLFGAVLIGAAVLLPIKQHRPKCALLGPVSLAIAGFVSVRIIISLLFPPVYQVQGFLFFGPAQTLLMTPSPIFTLIAGSPLIQTVSYGQAMWWTDLLFNSAALSLNFLGLGFLVWGWTELVGVQVDVAGASKAPHPATSPPKSIEFYS